VKTRNSLRHVPALSNWRSRFSLFSWEGGVRPGWLAAVIPSSMPWSTVLQGRSTKHAERSDFCGTAPKAMSISGLGGPIRREEYNYHYQTTQQGGCVHNKAFLLAVFSLLRTVGSTDTSYGVHTEYPYGVLVLLPLLPYYVQYRVPRTDPVESFMGA
jgi:hypothetical protein